MNKRKGLWLLLFLVSILGMFGYSSVWGASDYASGVTASSSTSVQFWFKPSGFTASYVILHYKVSGASQLNVYMTYNSNTRQWEYPVSGLSSGNTITYSYTYNKNGAQYDSASQTYTVGSNDSGSGGSSGVTFYQDANYGGTAVTISFGSYTLTQLQAAGIPNDWMSSLKVPSGYVVTVYQNDNFAGTKWTFTADTSYVGADCNDQMSSVVISASGSDSISSVSASTIPSPSGSGVMTCRVMNGTNGAYSDSQIYWAVLGINPATKAWCYLDLNGNLIPISNALNDASGHLTRNNINYANIYHTISQQQWFSLPQMDSGRMYLSVGSPCYIKTSDNGFAGPDLNNPSDPNLNVYFDFMEFTVDNLGYHGNVTRVDMFGFPIQHRLINKAGNYDQTVGELESETRSGLFSKYPNEVPPEFQTLGTLQAPYRIIAPKHGPFMPGGAYANYFAGYCSTWSTRQILLGEDISADNCAALNRHVYYQSNWNNIADYYNAAPANYYSKFWHTHSINGLAYGFCYDDVNNQAAYLSVPDPKGVIIRVGW